MMKSSVTLSLSKGAPLFALIVALAFVPAFVHSDYLLTLFDTAGIYAIVVMGLGILLGLAG
ncbi:MAG: hypothetical protein QOF71_1669, partial [Candidatus Eremiobacteraeota bacterium]|nr:hypothetical protein [Candidatus Eremiobacteraeota bacterium]